MWVRIMKKNEDILAMFVLLAVFGIFLLVTVFKFGYNYVWIVTAMCTLASLYVLVLHAIKVKKQLAILSGGRFYLSISSVILYILGISLVIWILADSKLYSKELIHFDDLAVVAFSTIFLSFMLLILEAFIALFFTKRNGLR